MNGYHTPEGLVKAHLELGNSRKSSQAEKYSELSITFTTERECVLGCLIAVENQILAAMDTGSLILPPGKYKVDISLTLLGDSSPIVDPVFTATEP